jgi:hypothetical protein
MKTFLECGISADQLAEIKGAVRKRVAGRGVQDFLIGLLELSFRDGDQVYSRDQIAAIEDPNRTDTSSNYWADEKKLRSQFDIHQTYLSERLGGRLLSLECLRERRPYEYRLGLADPAAASIPFVLEGSIFRYRAHSEHAGLSFYGRLIHPGVGRESADYRRWIFLTPVLLLLFALISVGLLMALVSISLPPGSAAFLQSFLLLALLAAGTWWLITSRWGRLADDRILLLGSSEIAGAQEGVVLDRYDEGGTRSYVMRRYIANCPICREETISLSRGEPEFRKRIVGRCANSPREHVFSFDRVTLEGSPLRLRPSSLAAALAADADHYRRST